MKMQDAVVLVTGANRGLGRELVKEALAAGARKVYATARDPRRLEALVVERPEQVVALALDITDASQIAEVAARAGDVTMLINNAGVLASGKLLASTSAEIEREYGTNVFGTLAITRALLPALERSAKAQGVAAIVNVLSVASLANVPFLGLYASAKAASWSLTQALRVDLAAKHVHVHAVFAGAIDTDMVRAFDMAKTSPELVAKNIVAGVQADAEDIRPDPMSEQLWTLWQHDPKAVERALAAMS